MKTVSSSMSNGCVGLASQLPEVAQKESCTCKGSQKQNENSPFPVEGEFLGHTNTGMINSE